MDAPNISSNYPLGGAKIGPLWRDMWSAAVVGRWTAANAFAAEWAPRHGLSPKTARGLLRAAARAGLIEWESRPRGGAHGGPGCDEAWFKRAR